MHEHRRRRRQQQIRPSRTEGLREPPQSLPGPPDVVPVRAPHHAELADDALVAGLAVEDADAATAFVRRFQAKVFGLALAVTHDPALADDVAQEAFLRAWRAASTYDGLRGSVSAWLLTITRNAAIDAVRARRSVPADDDELDRLLQATLGGAGSTTPPANRRRRRSRPAGCWPGCALPPEQARSVVLAVFGGCTAEEISRRDGVPLGTAKTRIRTGLRRLRRTSSAAEPEQAHTEGGARWLRRRRGALADRSATTSTWSRSSSATWTDGGGPRWPPTCSGARRVGASTTRSRRRSATCCPPCQRCSRRSGSTSRCSASASTGPAPHRPRRRRAVARRAAAAVVIVVAGASAGGRTGRRRADGWRRRAPRAHQRRRQVGTVSMGDVDGEPVMVVAI